MGLNFFDRHCDVETYSNNISMQGLKLTGVPDDMDMETMRPHLLSGIHDVGLIFIPAYLREINGVIYAHGSNESKNQIDSDKWHWHRRRKTTLLHWRDSNPERKTDEPCIRPFYTEVMHRLVLFFYIRKILQEDYDTHLSDDEIESIFLPLLNDIPVNNFTEQSIHLHRKLTRIGSSYSALTHEVLNKARLLMDKSPLTNKVEYLQHGDLLVMSEKVCIHRRQRLARIPLSTSGRLYYREL